VACEFKLYGSVISADLALAVSDQAEMMRSES